MADLVTFKLRFPEFEDVIDARIQLFLDDAALMMSSPIRWLDFYDVAQCYHAAHLLYVALYTESGDGGVLAPVKKQEVDDVVVEQAVGSVKPTALDWFSTAYGKQYYQYMRLVFAGPRGV